MRKTRKKKKNGFKSTYKPEKINTFNNLKNRGLVPILFLFSFQTNYVVGIAPNAIELRFEDIKENFKIKLIIDDQGFDLAKIVDDLKEDRKDNLYAIEAFLTDCEGDILTYGCMDYEWKPIKDLKIVKKYRSHCQKLGVPPESVFIN